MSVRMTEAVNPMIDPAALAELEAVIADARLRPVAEQTRLVMGVADLYAGKSSNDETLPAFADFFTRLVIVAAFEVRQGLSRRLGSADWLPRELVRALARDDIEIARPVISASPLLQDDDLIELLAKASTDHRLQVALRPGLGQAVAEVILQGQEPLLLTALASNIHAQLPADGMSRLVAASEKISSLRVPLARHPRLDASLAMRLYQWVGDVIRDQLCARYPTHADRLKQAVGDTVDELHESHIAKRMEAAGHLTPLYLMRLLREKQRGLFIRCLSLMAGIQVNEIEHLLAKPSARPFYLVCLAAGVEREVFPTLLQALRNIDPNVPPDLLMSELRLGDRARYQAKLELRAYIDSLAAVARPN